MRAAARAPAPQRFAVVSDRHGKLPAVIAEIAEMAAAGLEDVVNLGDLVSGPLWPAETGSPHARWALVERANGRTAATGGCSCAPRPMTSRPRRGKPNATAAATGPMRCAPAGSAAGNETENRNG